MSSFEHIKEIYCKINEGTFSFDDHESLRKTVPVIGGEMQFFDSKVPYLTAFSVYFRSAQISKINVTISSREIKISDFIPKFGNYKVAYNFRDDFTLVSFSEFKDKKKVKDIHIELNGNISNVMGQSVSLLTFLL